MTERWIGSKDPLFTKPFVDVDAWRDDPVPHRYVHGGFEGTETRFSFYFPPPEVYEGRFFQPIDPVGGNEHTVTGYGWTTVDFAAAHGAYLVESNHGRLNPRGTRSADPAAPSIGGYRANAAAARYSRVVAAEMYGAHRPYGYCFGGSGGGVKTITCIENTVDVWDGAVPFVQPHMATQNHFSATLHLCRVLRDKFPQIVDALDPGGSGDMFAGLDAEEREALAEVTGLGFPPRALFDYEAIVAHNAMLGAMGIETILEEDPEYFEDFWSVPGYLGAEPPASLARAVVEHKGTVTQLLSLEEATARGLGILRSNVSGPVAARIDGLPASRDLQGATLTIASGNAAGRMLFITHVDDDVVRVSESIVHGEGLIGVEVGDEVLVDNKHVLAYQTCYRHDDDPGWAEWDQLRANGAPVYPQRPVSVSRRFFRRFTGTNYRGRFAGKMIVVQTLMDEDCYPANAVYYRGLVESVLGPELDERYRLWFIDFAMHSPLSLRPPEPGSDKAARVIDYLGAVQQALLDLSAWVERGVIPPASTRFRCVDGQIVVPSTAAERRGIQPIVTLCANGGARTEVSVGEPVELRAIVEVPPGAGTVVSAEWDHEGRGDYPTIDTDGLDGSPDGITVTTSHTYTTPGTYFPALRVACHRQSDVTTPYARVFNLGRARVVVREN